MHKFFEERKNQRISAENLVDWICSRKGNARQAEHILARHPEESEEIILQEVTFIKLFLSEVVTKQMAASSGVNPNYLIRQIRSMIDAKIMALEYPEMEVAHEHQMGWMKRCMQYSEAFPYADKIRQNIEIGKCLVLLCSSGGVATILPIPLHQAGSGAASPWEKEKCGEWAAELYPFAELVNTWISSDIPGLLPENFLRAEESSRDGQGEFASAGPIFEGGSAKKDSGIRAGQLLRWALSEDKIWESITPLDQELDVDERHRLLLELFYQRVFFIDYVAQAEARASGQSNEALLMEFFERLPICAKKMGIEEMQSKEDLNLGMANRFPHYLEVLRQSNSKNIALGFGRVAAILTFAPQLPTDLIPGGASVYDLMSLGDYGKKWLAWFGPLGAVSAGWFAKEVPSLLR